MDGGSPPTHDERILAARAGSGRFVHYNTSLTPAGQSSRSSLLCASTSADVIVFAVPRHGWGALQLTFPEAAPHISLCAIAYSLHSLVCKGPVQGACMQSTGELMAHFFMFV